MQAYEDVWRQRTPAAAQRFLTGIWEQHRRTIAFVTHDIDEAIFLGDTVYTMTPRPGRLRDVIPVDIPRPRTLDEFGTPRFGERRRTPMTDSSNLYSA